jgi:hypothetical protein
MAQRSAFSTAAVFPVVFRTYWARTCALTCVPADNPSSALKLRFGRRDLSCQRKGRLEEDPPHFSEHAFVACLRRRRAASLVVRFPGASSREPRFDKEQVRLRPERILFRRNDPRLVLRCAVDRFPPDQVRLKVYRVGNRPIEATDGRDKELFQRGGARPSDEEQAVGSRGQHEQVRRRVQPVGCAATFLIGSETSQDQVSAFLPVLSRQLRPFRPVPGKVPLHPRRYGRCIVPQVLARYG